MNTRHENDTLSAEFPYETDGGLPVFNAERYRSRTPALALELLETAPVCLSRSVTDAARLLRKRTPQVFGETEEALHVGYVLAGSEIAIAIFFAVFIVVLSEKLEVKVAGRRMYFPPLVAVGSC